jgi:hypothetical protein
VGSTGLGQVTIADLNVLLELLDFARSNSHVIFLHSQEIPDEKLKA